MQETQETVSICRLGRSPGVGNNNPLQCSCWKIPRAEEYGGLQSIGLKKSDMTEQLSRAIKINKNVHKSKRENNSRNMQQERAKCVRRNSVLMRWMKLEPIIQSEVSQKEKHQYSILTHIYGI